MATTSTSDLVDAFIKAFSVGNITKIEGFYSDDYVNHTPYLGTRVMKMRTISLQ
jgi:hypothetical protein